jgi:hypothetical protein
MRKGTIYKIEINDSNIYVGATTQILCKRQAEHNYKKHKLTERKLYKMCIENNIDVIKCIWVADVEYDSNAELRMKEEQYRKELNANLNMRKCYISDDERYELNIEYRKEYRDNNQNKIIEYRQKNKSKTSEYNKTYRQKNQDKIQSYRENHRTEANLYNKKYREKKKSLLLNEIN